jgi:diguanylate cyclase (GGDEF)-like protein
VAVSRDPESPDAEPDSVLVVEDDRFIARLLEVELKVAGFRVRIANDGATALQAALEDPPDLVLADVMMPGMDGFELTRRLRDDHRTEGVSIIIVTARGLAADKLTGLTAGADDYIVKPFDNEEMLARVRGALRRAKYMRAQSPLTGLPGNVRIEDEIQTRVERGEEFALMYLDLDNFKAYSDRYGFVRGDEALRTTGRIIRDAAKGVGGTAAFVGHIGGDDFVVVTTPDLAVPIAEEVIARFDAAVPSLYEEEEATRGYIEAEDRSGQRRRFPLLSISIGVATTRIRRFAHRAEVVQIATEMKNFAKRTPGSSFAVDRRSAP